MDGNWYFGGYITDVYITGCACCGYTGVRYDEKTKNTHKLEQLKYNHQIVYYHQKNYLGIAWNLMSFGYLQFKRITLVTNLEELKKLSETVKQGKLPETELVAKFAVDQLMNSIRLTICFENFMKALLLLNGLIIHKLDKNHFPELGKKQFSEPIKIEDVLKDKTWEFNQKIDSPNKDWTKQIKGILRNTIGMRVLLSPNYQKVFNIESEVFETCKPYFEYRNNLHLYTGEQFSYGGDSYDEIIKLIEFINGHLVRIHNRVTDELEKDDQYKLSIIDLNEK